MIQNAATVAAIAALDFTAIKRHLMRAARTGWSAARADAVELEYRRFLYLIKLHPDEALQLLQRLSRFESSGASFRSGGRGGTIC
jgi:hypothetical protein